MKPFLKLFAWGLLSLVALVYSLVSHASLGEPQAESPYTTAKRYDFNGRVTGIILPDPDGSGPLKYSATRNTYENGVLVQTVSGYLSEWQSQSVAPENWQGFQFTSIKKLTYDDQGRKVSDATVDLSGNLKALTEYSYDQFGNLECVAVRLNLVLQGNACEPYQSAEFGWDRVTKYDYNRHADILKEYRAVGTPLEQLYKEYTYYPNRKIETVTDAKGNLTHYEYDDLKRLEYWYFPSKISVGSYNSEDYEKYSYDDNGNRTVLRKRDGSLIVSEYDNLNRPNYKHYFDRLGASSTTTSDVYYKYNLIGLQTEARFGSSAGKGIFVEYDGFGAVSEETNDMNGTYRVSHTYDLNGNRSTTQYPDGPTFTYSHDGLDRLESIFDPSDSNSKLLTQAYDQYARPEFLKAMGGGAAVTTLGYNDLSQLNNATLAFGGDQYDLSLEFEYSPASQVTVMEASNDLYDHQDGLGHQGGYYVNGLNQYESVAGQALIHDDNGNLTDSGDKQYGYDVENRLISVTDVNGTSASLVYDPNGRLHQYSVNGSTTQFHYDGDSIIAEYLNGNMVGRYLHAGGLGTPLAGYLGSSVATSNIRFFHTNHQGSVIAASDSNGEVDYTNTYDAFGVAGELNQGRFSYTGQILLEEIDLYHYRARVYDPAFGRFLQTDPVGYADNINLYAYVGNDPMNMVDPSGMVSCPPGDNNCVETPESENEVGPPEPTSDETREVEEVVVTGHKNRVEGMRFNINDEMFFTASAEGMVQRPTTQTDTKCSDGSTVTSTRFAGGLAAGEAAVHTHASGRGGRGGHVQYPSHGDGAAARQSSIGAAFMMTKGRVFTIEALSSGRFRTTLVRGRALSGREKDALVKNMQHWEKPASAKSGGACMQ